jgi:CubicO group peptidase (beta-lactamase class C family)
MKHNALHSRIITLLTIMLVVGAVSAMLARGQQVSSIRARVQVPSGPVSRELLFPQKPPAPYPDELERTLGTFQRVDACVETFMAAYRVPGASIAIIDNRAFVYEKGYGVKHREQGGAVTPDTVFRFGSTLKMMTAAALMQQVEQGRVDLQAPITRYIPEFQVAGPWPSDTISAWNLLTHTSSFPDRYDQYMFRNGLAGPTTPTALSDWAAGQSAIPLYAPPGSFWNYSNPNFSLAGLIAERASGLEYHQYMEDRVFGPAGMTSATLLPSDVLAFGDYAYEHYTDPFTGQSVIAAPDAYDNWVMAPAGLGFATARDLARFAWILMQGGSPILTSSSAEIMQSPQIDMQIGEPIYYGFGVMVLPDYFGANLRMHGGNVFGSSSSLIWAPDYTFAVSLLFNGEASPDDAALCAYAAFHPLTGEAPPNASLPPSEWGKYAGNYRGRFYGHWNWRTGGEIVTYDGLEITATVTKVRDQLVVRMPELTVNDPQTPVGLDNFLAAKLGPLYGLFTASYLDDPWMHIVSNFIRNRSFVLIREGSTASGR